MKSQKQTLKNELNELLKDCQDSPYWKRKPKSREFRVEHEKVEQYYDDLVIQSLKEYDNICGQKFGNKVCFQKHCPHKQKDEKQSHDKIVETESKKENPIDLLIKAIEFLESQKEETHEIVKLVDYENTDDEESPDTITSETEEELITGQAPLYLPLAGFFQQV